MIPSSPKNHNGLMTEEATVVFDDGVTIATTQQSASFPSEMKWTLRIPGTHIIIFISKVGNRSRSGPTELSFLRPGQQVACTQMDISTHPNSREMQNVCMQKFQDRCHASMDSWHRHGRGIHIANCFVFVGFCGSTAMTSGHAQHEGIYIYMYVIDMVYANRLTVLARHVG